MSWNKILEAPFEPKYRNKVLVLFIIFSLGMMACITWFRTVKLIDGPQHTHFGQHSYLYENLINDGSGLFGLHNSYSLFFVLDFIWPVLLLILVGHFYKRIISFVVHDTRHMSFVPRKIGKKTFDNKGDYLAVWYNRWRYVALFALLFDWSENICYLALPDFDFRAIVYVKMALYAIAIFIIPLITFHLHSKFGIFHHVKEFIRTTYMSLIVIAIIGFLMTFLSQGATIMIDILSSPVNLFFSFLFLNFLAIIISHYPVYIFFKTNEKVFSTYKYDLSKKRTLDIY